MAMREGSAITRSPTATAGPRSATGDPAGEEGRAGRSRASTNHRAFGTRKTGRAAAKVSLRRPLSALGRPDPDSHPLPPAPFCRCSPARERRQPARPLRYRRGLDGRHSLAELPRPPPPPSRSLPSAPPTARSRGRSQAERGSSLTTLPISAAKNPSLGGEQGASPRSQPGAGHPPPRDRQRGRISSAPPALPLWLSSPAATQLLAGDGSHGGLCLPAVRGARPAQPCPGPLTARGLAAPRGTYCCSYRSPGSRAAPAARAGPGRPRLLSPAPRCPRRGLARSAVRTMGSGPRWEGRRDKRGGRRSAPPPTPKSCRPPPSRRRSAQLPPPAVGWKPRA